MRPRARWLPSCAGWPPTSPGIRTFPGWWRWSARDPHVPRVNPEAREAGATGRRLAAVLRVLRDRAEIWLARLAPVLIIAAVFLTFLPTLGNHFVGWDDD